MGTLGVERLMDSEPAKPVELVPQIAGEKMSQVTPVLDDSVDELFALESTEVQTLLKLYAYRTAWMGASKDRDRINYVVRPDGRIYYALIPSTLNRWQRHLEECMSDE